MSEILLDPSPNLYLAFQSHDLLVSGDLLTVALKLKQHDSEAEILIFNATDGKQVDLDLSGSQADLKQRFAGPANIPLEASKPKKRGRPKLGVVGREVTLLPRHWQWLDSQPGGASATLRRLVEQAKKDNSAKDIARSAQDATHRFITALAGNQPGFEEAIRALFGNDKSRFIKETKRWPKDVLRLTMIFSEDAFLAN